MGVDQPFLYDAPSRISFGEREFNPKAVTQASRQPIKARPKSEGHLVEFNKHPDSYIILPYGNVNAKPMKPRTRKTVQRLRQLQLLVRCLQLLGALGLLICVLCIRGVEESLGWTLRVPPVMATLHCAYAIYHLSRSSTSRTPASTASYMLFATTMDSVFLPFYVFTALISNTQLVKHPDMAWRSVLANPIADRRIVRAALLFGIINGSLHLISLLISVYLSIVFRKIARLPPDMNPLEDNLTSRHKRSRSSVAEKHDGHVSTVLGMSEAGHSKRGSQAHDPLIAPPRSIPFMHTRVDSTESFPGYQHTSPGIRNSRADMPSQLRHLETKRTSGGDLTRSSGVGSPTKRSSYYTENTPPQRISRSSLMNDNWYTYFNHEEPSVNENVVRADSIVSSMNDFELRMADETYHHDLPRQHDLEDEDHYQHHHVHGQQSQQQQQQQQSPFNRTLPNPLESNPPTPPPAAASIRRAILQDGSPNRGATPNSFKAKLYGDLRSATPPAMGTYVDIPLTRAGERAVSNSGTDYGNGFAVLPSGAPSPSLSRLATRDVSGKVAEEGRGGGGWSARFRKVSGK